MPEGPKPPPSTPPTAHISKAAVAPPRTPCVPHVWVLKPAEKPYTADQKKERLRKAGDVGSVAEAAAADHNKVTEGADMSGANHASRVNQVCSICGDMGGDVDHVNRDEGGKVSEIVEVKGGKCNVDKDQLLRRKALADSMGAGVRVKLTGPGAETAKGVIEKAPELAGISVTVF